MDDPLDDCEAIEIVDGFIKSIGQRPTAISDVPAQYMGLLKFSPAGFETLLKFFLRGQERSSDYRSVSMTELLNDMAACGSPVAAVAVSGGWLEIDSREDLVRYRDAALSGTLHALWEPDR